MAIPSITHRTVDPGNYAAGGTVAHMHRSAVLDGSSGAGGTGSGYDLSSAPDGSLVVCFVTLGHEHSADTISAANVGMDIFTGAVADYTGDPGTLTQVLDTADLDTINASDSTMGGWAYVEENASSTIVISGMLLWFVLGDGTGNTIDKADFTETDGSGDTEITFEFTTTGGVYPVVDSWLGPVITVFEPSGGDEPRMDSTNADIVGDNGASVTATIPTYTPTNDDTKNLVFMECIADAFVDSSITNWTNLYSEASDFTQGYEQDTTTPASIGGETQGVTNSAFADAYVLAVAPVYFPAENGGAPVEADDTSSGTGTHTAPASDADIKIQRGVVDVTTDGQTVTLGTAVASLDNAFVILANNRHQGAGPNGSSANQEADDMGVSATLTATDTITFGRAATGNSTRASWIVVEYVGEAGGDNEFIVRGRDETTFTSVATNTLTLTNTPTSIDDCIPFIQGIHCTDTGNGGDNLVGRAWLSSTATLNVAGSEGDSSTSTVAVVTVEFTGSNWSVGHGTLEGQTADAGDISLVSAAAGTGGSTFDVGDWATALISSWGYVGDTTNEAIADNWAEHRIGDGGGGGAATAEVRYLFHGNHDGTDDDFTVHVLKHADLAVTRFTSTANAANETTIDITSAGLTDLEQSLVTGTGTSSGSGTAYGRGWRNFYLNSLTQAAHWCHRSGNTIAITMDVVDFSAVETVGAGGNTGSGTPSETADTGGGSGTHTPPVRTGSGTPTETADTSTGVATHTPPTSTGSSATTDVDDSSAGVGVSTVPVFTGSGTPTEEVDVSAGTGTHAEPVFTGSAAETEDNDTSAGDGTFAVPVYTGSAAVTEEDDAPAGSGTRTVPVFTGSGAETEDDDVSAGVGTASDPVWTATGTPGEADDVSVGTGTHAAPVFTGTAAAVEVDDMSTGVGTNGIPTFTGSAVETEDDDVSVGSASFTPAPITGTGISSETDDTSTGVGTHTAPVVTGSGSVTEVDDTPAGSGTFTAPVFTGSGAITEEGHNSTGSGTFLTLTATGSGAVTEADDSPTGTGVYTAPVVTGAGTPTEDDDVSDGAGTAGAPTFTGAGAATAADDIPSGSGTFTPLFTGSGVTGSENDVSAGTGQFLPVFTATGEIVESDDIADGSATAEQLVVFTGSGVLQELSDVTVDSLTFRRLATPLSAYTRRAAAENDRRDRRVDSEHSWLCRRTRH